ncbi:MAG: hypothetical protein ABI723_06730 [Bacteroidia bacterium]
MKFSDIIGQQSIKQRLINSVKNNRVSHAQLFYEQPGAGGLPLAVAYAQYLNCENKTDVDSCGICSSCLKIEKLVHPDLHFAVPTASDSKQDKKALTTDYAVEWRKAFIDNPYLNLNDWFYELGFETNKQLILSADESADIIRKLSFKNFEAAYKVCIIWCPEKWNATSANALLKIIEEPPDKTVFILVTENYDQLLPTILSRTQLIKIPKVGIDELMQVLKTKHKVSDDDVKRIVHMSDGSYRAAMEFAEEENNDKYEVDFLNWMRLCLSPIKNYSGLNEWIEIMSKKKREMIKNFIAFGLETCRECMLINYADIAMVRFDEQQFPGLSKFAPFVNQNNAEEFSKQLSEAHYHIERNANAKILFLDLSFKVAKLLAVK